MLRCSRLFPGGKHVGLASVNTYETHKWRGYNKYVSACVVEEAVYAAPFDAAHVLRVKHVSGHMD
eukprot:9944076-Prorocentrum_lima.AAC.1